MIESFAGVKNIIFDLGGVILNINYQKTIDEFVKLGVSNFESIFSQSKQSKISNQFEKGEILEVEFYESIKELSGVDFSFLQFKYAWNAMLLDLPQSRINLLKELKKEYRLFLFSNTNETHYNEFVTKVKDDFDSIFEKTYYSHQFGERKPEPEAFEKLLKENNLEPEETLFIDDSIQHINGAKSLEIQTIFHNNTSLSSIFGL